MSALIELLIATVTTGVGGYLTKVLRKLDRKLDDVDTHDRALFGDEATGWPGLVPLVQEEGQQIATDGGQVEQE